MQCLIPMHSKVLLMAKAQVLNERAQPAMAANIRTPSKIPIIPQRLASAENA